MDIPMHVAVADGDTVELSAIPQANQAAFLHLGFTASSPNSLKRKVDDDQQKAALFGQLRDLGVCFARGREWSPAEVFEWLRDQKLLQGSFTALAWRRAGEWFVEPSQ